MTISVSGPFPSQPAYTSSSAIGSPATPPFQELQTSDEVTISQSAQVKQLSQQGHTASQIAQTLGISVSLVDLELGIVSTSTQAPVQVPKTTAPARPEASKLPASKVSA